MPYIENVSMADIKNGNHKYSDILIQIVDPGYGFPVPRTKFIEVYQCEFLDAEKSDQNISEDCKITEDQADLIASILYRAQDMNYNVTVHCHMGVCRSGAVAAASEVIGFELANNLRMPNLMVKNYILNAIFKIEQAAALE